MGLRPEQYENGIYPHIEVRSQLTRQKVSSKWHGKTSERKVQETIESNTNASTKQENAVSKLEKVWNKPSKLPNWKLYLQLLTCASVQV